MFFIKVCEDQTQSLTLGWGEFFIVFVLRCSVGGKTWTGVGWREWESNSPEAIWETGWLCGGLVAASLLEPPIEKRHVLNKKAIEELNNRFGEVNTELLLCISSSNPCAFIAAFDPTKWMRLAKFYPNEFPDTQLMQLENQIETFIIDLQSERESFQNFEVKDNLVKGWN